MPKNCLIPTPGCLEAGQNMPFPKLSTQAQFLGTCKGLEALEACMTSSQASPCCFPQRESFYAVQYTRITLSSTCQRLALVLSLQGEYSCCSFHALAQKSPVKIAEGHVPRSIQSTKIGRGMIGCLFCKEEAGESDVQPVQNNPYRCLFVQSMPCSPGIRIQMH